MNERRSSRRAEPRRAVLSGVQRELAARYRFAERFAKGCTALVLGAGDGAGAARLAALARRVVALDPSPVAVQRAVRRYPRPNLRFAVGGPAVGALAPGAFDLVTAFHRLDRVADWPAFLDGLRLVLRPSGRLIVAVENAAWRPLERLRAELPAGGPAFGLAELHDLLVDRFIIEAIAGQSSTARALLTHTVECVRAAPAVPALDLADRAAAVVGPATLASRYFVAVGRRR
jgi:SAM-dependent methyltransferase